MSIPTDERARVATLSLPSSDIIRVRIGQQAIKAAGLVTIKFSLTNFHTYIPVD